MDILKKTKLNLFLVNSALFGILTYIAWLGIREYESWRLGSDLTREVPMEQVSISGSKEYRLYFLARYEDGKCESIDLIRGTTETYPVDNPHRMQLYDELSWRPGFLTLPTLKARLTGGVPKDEIPVRGKKTFQGVAVVEYVDGFAGWRSIHLVPQSIRAE
ncbi:MAG TPA: hypothetical protein VN420_05475 [Candidatus Fimivivens sp.]|nr:hypothetical protein [Candidatus Fimivivens sp.]